MSIQYTYEIINVDPQARVMEVIYSSPGHQTMHISARLPYDDEVLDAVIQMYSPVAYWIEQQKAVAVPTVGASGEFIPPELQPRTLGGAKTAKLAEIADWRYRREVGGVTVGGARIKTDRESQATVTGAFTAMSQGLLQSVDWKAANDQWVTLTLPEMTAIAQAVTAHVQECFTLEKQYAALVDQAQTIEAVDNIVLPAL